MRVTHVISSLDPSTGGPPVVCARLAAAQAAMGIKTRILSYQSRTAQENVELSLRSIPGIEDVEIRYLDPLTRGEHLVPRNARRLLASLSAESDLLHLHGIWDPIVRTGALVAEAAGKAFVITAHGMLDPWALAQKRLKKKLAMAAGYRRILNRSAFIHFLNNDEQALADSLGLKSPRRVIPNGVFLEEFKSIPSRGAFYASHPELDNRPYILFLSRLHYKKGLDYLADAFALICRQMPEPLLVVAGPDDGAGAVFRSQVQKLGMQDRVHMVGPLYGAAKLAAMRDARCFCLPSRQEGFSLAVLEAMACGTPVIISPQCHFQEAGAAGRIAPLNAPALAQAMQELLSDPAGALAMGQAGRAMVEAHYTWPRVARTMIDAYLEVSQEPRSPSARV